MRLSKIEKQPFIFCRYDLVTPVTHFRFMPHISSKNGERVAMIAIAGDHLPTCVAAIEDQRTRSRPSAHSTARICAIDAANKKGAAAADELFHQNGRRIRALQLPCEILDETECRRLPRREKSQVRQPTATNHRARRYCGSFAARPAGAP